DEHAAPDADGAEASLPNQPAGRPGTVRPVGELALNLFERYQLGHGRPPLVDVARPLSLARVRRAVTVERFPGPTRAELSRSVEESGCAVANALLQPRFEALVLAHTFVVAVPLREPRARRRRQVIARENQLGDATPRPFVDGQYLLQLADSDLLSRAR